MKTDNIQREQKDPQFRVIAVLPFRDRSPETQRGLAAPVSELLIEEIGKVRGLEVIDWNTARQYPGADVPVRNTARQLGAGAAVAGSFSFEAMQVRAEMEMISARSGEPLWRRRFRRPLDRLPEVIRTTVLEMAAVLEIPVSRTEKRLLAPVTFSDSEVLTHYLQALQLWNRATVEDYKAGIAGLLECLRLDPAFSPAYARLAHGYAYLGLWGYLPLRQVYPRAVLAARKALELDRRHARAYYASALTSWLLEGDPATAEREIDGALAINPSFAEARWCKALLQATARQDFSAAGAEMKKAQELDPLSPIHTAYRGWIAYWARASDDAVEHFWEAIEADGRLVSAWQGLGLANLQKGKATDAVDALQRAKSSSGDPYSIGLLGAAFGMAGMTDAAIAQLEELRQLVAVAPTLPQAWIWIGLGDKEKALDLLAAAFEERDPQLFWIRPTSLYDPLRSEKRFQDLLERM